MTVLDKNYNPAIGAVGGKYGVASLDSTGATAGQAPIYDGTNVAWATPAVAPGAITLTNAHVLVGNASNVATDVAISGVIAITNAGVTSIVDGSVVNADLNAAAAIDFSKLAALPSTNILVGSAGNVATAVAISGDATLSNAGALTIANSAISTAKIADNAVDGTKIAITSQTTGSIMYYDGTNWINLAPGTAGQVLTMNGGGTAPSWV